MVLLTLYILSLGLIGCCNCSQLPTTESSAISGDNVVALCLLAAFGTISLVGACAICFRRKKTFEKLENESGVVENIKKNEFPIFRALATEGNESSAIVPCERTNLSRDNLLNSTENLSVDDVGNLPKSDEVESSDIVLIEKTSSTRDRIQPTTVTTRDTIIYETEKEIKKHQSSPPSSSTPLLFANNVQSYQNVQPVTEQMQQKSASMQFAPESPLKDFYDVKDDEQLESVEVDKVKDDFLVISISEEAKEESATTASTTNPFFNSIESTKDIDNSALKDIAKYDISEVKNSVNDNYQILEEETDLEDVNLDLNEPATIQRKDSRSSNGSAGDNNSIEEALRALDIAIGSEDDGDDYEVEEDENKPSLDDVKSEATFLVESIVNDCEKIFEENQAISSEVLEPSFEDFSSLKNQNMSTPCNVIKFKSSGSVLESAKALFPEGLELSDIREETFTVTDKTFDVEPINEKTFDAPTKPNLPAIKIDMEESCSEDLTTVTPVNTPIELSYSSETWDKMTYSKGAISKQPIETPNKNVVLESDVNETITFNQDGWYLHPRAKNDTFEVCEYEEEEGNMEDMSSTYDQLRRQLSEMLPHAQGMSQHNDFLEDDDLNKDVSSPSENYGIKYGDLDEATNAGSFELLGALINPEPPATNEMLINYKRPLSPILEESECDDNSCRTFVFNETKLLDSTSTGIMESASAEAQMGQMPKTLMASNDTLFNFEDTLSDQTDNLLMSPRMNTAGSSGSSTLSRQESHDKVSLDRTPTNEEPPKNDLFGKNHELDAIGIVKNSIRQHPLNLDLTSPMPSTSKYEITVAKLAFEDGSWPLDLPEAQQSFNDLSSPEQNRTADSLSFEQDITYTIDDQRTCISLVLKNDDERISEISEPLFASESLDLLADDDDERTNSLCMEDIVSIEADSNFNYEVNDENGNQNGETKEMEMTLNVEEGGSAMFDNDSINPEDDVTSKKEFDIDSLDPENKTVDDVVEADSIVTVQSDINSYSVSAAVIAATTTDEMSDRRRKKGSSTDIRQVSCNQSMMTTSFTKEWSDDDSSRSSEEFMYVKGAADASQVKSDDEGAKVEEDESKNQTDENSPNEKPSENIEIIDIEVDEAIEKWKKAKNQIPATPIFHGDEPQMTNESEDESAEEGEFVPSSWDHSLQPKRSSLKSPEKEKPEEPEKKPRRVAFKLQRYHSVYEYPCEITQISPALSEPQLWSNYVNDSSGNIDYFTYAHQLSETASNFPHQIDGFTVSSSSRPFHVTAVKQLHNTWPNDATEFSWSQIQDLNETEDSTKTLQFPLKIEWPSRNSLGFDEDDSGERPDSGVGESSDSPSMGELCHTKSSLRLPLELVSSTSSEVSDFMSDHCITKDEQEATEATNTEDESLRQPKSLLDIEDDESDKLILPTPSCTGSMDSLSSNSGSSSSERGPPSFTTFGKDLVMTKESDVSGRTSIIFIEDDVESTHVEIQKNVRNIEGANNGVDEKYILSHKIVGSSDEDSGFENITRMAMK